MVKKIEVVVAYQCSACGTKWAVAELGEEKAKALAEDCERRHKEVEARLTERAINFPDGMW